jgi:hypothetical protein
MPGSKNKSNSVPINTALPSVSNTATLRERPRRWNQSASGSNINASAKLTRSGTSTLPPITMVKAIRPAMSSAAGIRRTHQNGYLICTVGEISMGITTPYQFGSFYFT